jgi:hypothetical protein
MLAATIAITVVELLLDPASAAQLEKGSWLIKRTAAHK